MNKLSPFSSLPSPILVLHSRKPSSSHLCVPLPLLLCSNPINKDAILTLCAVAVVGGAVSRMMVRFLKQGHSLDKWEQGEEMFYSAIEGNTVFYTPEEGDDPPSKVQQIGSVLGRSSDAAPKSCLCRESGNRDRTPSDIELLKEKFGKLLLGEDMSGGGKGVSSAVALSNAITNLAASVFAEQRRLEPMPRERKMRWRKEIDWLLSVTDHIVEFVPVRQVGSNIEIMTTQQRRDLQASIPALKKLDAMLLDYLDTFVDQHEFWYVSKGADESETRSDDKWWLPAVKVPKKGLSEVTKQWLLYQKEAVNQVLKAAMAINAQILMEMDIPEVYMETLPKNGRACLGDTLYRSITDYGFNPEQFLESMDLSTDHKILDLKDRIEASVNIWKRKMNSKDTKSWSSGVSLEKREQFEERAETILLLIKQRFPGSPQSSLDTAKIQYNRDVGQSVLESYSRVLESLAFTVMSQIEDVLAADSLAQNPANKEPTKRRSMVDSEFGQLKRLDPQEEMGKLKEAPESMTLSDFMGWHIDQEVEAENKNKDCKMKKPPPVSAKKLSYLEKLEHLRGVRSPTARR